MTQFQWCYTSDTGHQMLASFLNIFLLEVQKRFITHISSYSYTAHDNKIWFFCWHFYFRSFPSFIWINIFWKIRSGLRKCDRCYWMSKPLNRWFENNSKHCKAELNLRASNNRRKQLQKNMHKIMCYRSSFTCMLAVRSFK